MTIGAHDFMLLFFLHAPVVALAKEALVPHLSPSTFEVCMLQESAQMHTTAFAARNAGFSSVIIIEKKSENSQIRLAPRKHRLKSGCLPCQA